MVRPASRTTAERVLLTWMGASGDMVSDVITSGQAGAIDSWVAPSRIGPQFEEPPSDPSGQVCRSQRR